MGIREECFRGKGGNGRRTAHNGRRCGGSGIISSAIFCPETLAMDQEHVSHGSDLIVRLAQKDPVWVSHGVLIIPSRNIEVFPEADESLWEKYRISPAG